MNPDTLIPALYIFSLAAFVGYLVLSRVPPLLHTPLMSATNAISGISLVGSIITAGAQHSTTRTALGFEAVAGATINVLCVFAINERTLKFFRRKGAAEPQKKE